MDYIYSRTPVFFRTYVKELLIKPWIQNRPIVLNYGFCSVWSSKRIVYTAYDTFSERSVKLISFLFCLYILLNCRIVYLYNSFMQLSVGRHVGFDVSVGKPAPLFHFPNHSSTKHILLWVRACCLQTMNFTKIQPILLWIRLHRGIPMVNLVSWRHGTCFVQDTLFHSNCKR